MIKHKKYCFLLHILYLFKPKQILRQKKNIFWRRIYFWAFLFPNNYKLVIAAKYLSFIEKIS
jgi:hypothetical protein